MLGPPCPQGTSASTWRQCWLSQLQGWHLVGGGQDSFLTKNPAPLFTVAGPGAEWERVHVSCLLFESHRPLPDVMTFQSVIEALGLFGDC